jgi:hypothetical protein
MALGIQIIISLFSIVLITDKENPSDINKGVIAGNACKRSAYYVFFIQNKRIFDFEIYKNNLIEEKKGRSAPLQDNDGIPPV